jgi:hypothetical protein
LPDEGLPLFVAAGDPMLCHCSTTAETAGHDCCVPFLTKQTHANNISSLVWLKALSSILILKKKKNESRQPMKQKAWVTETQPWHC